LAQAWGRWFELQLELKRLRVLTAKVVLRWQNRNLAKAFQKWYHELVRTRKAHKAVLMWKHRSLSKAWGAWYEHHIQIAMEKEGNAEVERLRKMMARMAMKKWMNASLLRAWNKWRYELRRTRLAKKVVKRWTHRALSKAWLACVLMVLEKKRLRSVAKKVVAHWTNRLMAQALNTWWDEVVRTRKTAKAILMWVHAALGRALRAWDLMVMEKKRLRALTIRVVMRWANRALAKAWETWYEEHVRILRLRNLKAKTLQRWLNIVLSKAFTKWFEELVRARKARKAVKMWRNHTLGRAWRTWQFKVMDLKRLRGLMSKALRRWKNRALSQAWQSWYDEHIKCVRLMELKAQVLMRWQKRTMTKAYQKWWSELRRSRIARRTVANFMRKTLCKTWRTWEGNVAPPGKNGVCPVCGKKDEDNDGSWEEAMHEHEQIEKELAVTEEGGFVGLQVTEVPPHFVKQVNDLVDRNFVRHDQPGYRNPKIVPGDRILQVDGRDAEHATLDALHKMLKGPLHSTVLLSLARVDTGERYTVEALRHGKYSFDGPSGLPQSMKDAVSQRSTGSVGRSKSPVTFRADTTGIPSLGGLDVLRHAPPMPEARACVCVCVAAFSCCDGSVQKRRQEEEEEEEEEERGWWWCWSSTFIHIQNDTMIILIL